MKNKKGIKKIRFADIAPDMIIDIRALDALAVDENCEVVLYFEEDLARNSTYEKDLEDYHNFPEHERPFILVNGFLSFQREMNPIFDDALAAVPLEITIVSTGTYQDRPLVIGLLPFLDEVDIT